MPYTHRIECNKTYKSGIMNGQTIRVGFPTTEDAVSMHVESYQKYLEGQVGRDVITGSKFVVSDLKVVELYPKD